MVVGAEGQQGATDSDGHGVITTGSNGSDAGWWLEFDGIKALDGLGEGDGYGLGIGALHEGNELLVAQLAVLGIPPGKDFAVCSEGKTVCFTGGSTYNTFSSDGFHQGEDTFIVEVAVPELSVTPPAAAPQLANLTDCQCVVGTSAYADDSSSVETCDHLWYWELYGSPPTMAQLPTGSQAPCVELSSTADGGGVATACRNHC